MSQKRVSGPAAGPVDPVTARVRAALEAVESRADALAAAWEELDPENKPDALYGPVMDLLRQMTGLQAMIIPMAAHLDVLVRWQQEIMAWQTEINGRMLLMGRRQ